MLPLPVLDDKSFRELVEDALKLIPRFTPDWTDYNPHDPGITFIELFAWLTEMQQFYMDQVGEHNYLKFLQLLGVKPEEAVPAKVDVTFSLPAETAAASPVSVPRGTRLQAGEVIFETLETIRLNTANLEKIITATDGDFTDNTDANRLMGLYYYAFGEKAEKGSGLYLGFDHTPEEITLTFNLFEAYPAEGSHDGEQPEIIPPARISWEYGFRSDSRAVVGADQGEWLPLNIVKDETLGLFRSGRVYLVRPDTGLPPAGMKMWLRCIVKQAGYEIPPRIENILLNTVGAIQQETLSGADNLPQLSSNGLPGQKISLHRTPVFSSTFALQVEEKKEKGDREELEWRDWQRVDDFDASRPDDRHYLLNSETGEVLFGDGVNGAVPPAPAGAGRRNIRVVSYQVGGGEKGNVKSGAVNKLICPPGSELALLRVENRLPAVGGAEAETLEQAKARARRELNTVSRAVTFADFEKLACMTPGLRVARAKAFSPGEDGVKVVVVPYSPAPNPTPGEGFLETVRRHLDRHRLVTTKVEVLPPQYTVVDVYASVGIKPRYEPAATRELILTGLEKFLHPVWGGPEGAGWPFGRKVYKSELYQLIENIEGVDFVKELKVTGPEEGDRGNDEVKPQRLVYLGERRVDIIGPEPE